MPRNKLISATPGLVFAVGLWIAAVVGCADRGGSSTDAPRFRDVLLEELVGAPSIHDGQLVRVVGVCQVQFEGTVLWLNEQARLDGQLDKALWLAIGWPPTPDISALAGQHVVVEARFDARQNGHMGCCRGTLLNIERMSHSTQEANQAQRRRAMNPS